MTTFTLDENLSCTKVVDACTAHGGCAVERFPSSMRGMKDPDLLPIILAGDKPLVTFDANMVDEHFSFIPVDNPGIVIVRLRRPSATMTWKLGLRLLAAFKSHYPLWPSTDLKGIRLELNETGVCLSLIISHRDCKIVDYDDPDFDTITARNIASLQAKRLALLSSN